MKLYFLGGAMEIGGSRIYIKVGGYGVLFDAGIRQGSAKDPLPDFQQIQENGGIDIIVISHAHLDHIGTLPIISKAYPQAKIYMTHMTQDLVRVLLYDSLKIMGRNEDEIPHYAEIDVKNMLARISPMRFQTPMEILENLILTFYPAGHIAGASCVYLETQEGSIFYSGDFASFSQRTIEGAKVPKLRPDVTIVESTYGNRLHANRQVEENRLVELVKEYINQEGKVLIPAFALGRAQEVLLILRSAMEKGEIPKVPVYVDGMVRDINAMYFRNPTYLKNILAKRIWKGNDPFYTEQIQAVPSNVNRDELLEKKEAAIFVSSSGMLTGGPSMVYAKKIATIEKNCIILTGYQDEEAPGRALLSLLEETGDKKIVLDGSVIPVNCRVEQVGLSAHGDKSEITALIERITARKIFLVHGDCDAIEDVAKELASDYKKQVFMPKCGEAYEIEIHNKRKQIHFTLPYSMQKEQMLAKENEKELWEYIRTYYPKNVFTIAQLAFVWCGKNISDDEYLQQMQEILYDSIYFSQDTRRLFLFVANTEDEVVEKSKPKKVTNQDLQQCIENIVKDLDYKKIGFFEEKQLVTLTVDYPDAVDEKLVSIYAKEFEIETGWKLELSSSVNHQMMGQLLRELFQGRLEKLSYYQEKKEYVVTLSAYQEDDDCLVHKFYETTRWNLSIKGKSMGSNVKVVTVDRQGTVINLVYTPENSVEMLEQNLAFSCIEQSFEDEPYKPYKKGIKNDSNGKYIILSFLSPEIGRKECDIIQQISNQTGWRIQISDSVNQNEIMNILGVLCKKYDIQLKKNPSYLPQNHSFRVKVEGDDKGLPKELQDEFMEKTGCCVVVG